MVRVPIGNSKSMRVEVRSVAPDANPYLTLYSIFRTGIDGTTARSITCARRSAICLTISKPRSTIKASAWIAEILGADVQGRFADLKQAAANRSPRELGTFVKGSEVQYHHEVYNQSLWNQFLEDCETLHLKTKRAAQAALFVLLECLFYMAVANVLKGHDFTAWVENSFGPRFARFCNKGTAGCPLAPAVTAAK